MQPLQTISPSGSPPSRSYTLALDTLTLICHNKGPVRNHTNQMKCQLCSKPITVTYFDVSIPRLGGQWGNICPTCFDENACKLGMGLGQRYDKQPDGTWKKMPLTVVLADAIFSIQDKLYTVDHKTTNDQRDKR